jgi:subtilisin family serine protease
MPGAAPDELAAAIVEAIEAGARVLNLSLALVPPSDQGVWNLNHALDYAARRGVITVVAAGNQGQVGTSALTGHPWVLPVVACDYTGRPLSQSNLAGSIGRWGLSAPGEGVTSLSPDGGYSTISGTSVAVPLVTGSVALLWSEFPRASAGAIKLAVTRSAKPRRRSIVPPILDAWAAYEALALFGA